MVCPKKPWIRTSIHGVSYSQKFLSKCSFISVANGRTSQFMFSKYLIEYQNAKIVKSKFKSGKNKNKKQKQRSCNGKHKKDIELDMM